MQSISYQLVSQINIYTLLNTVKPAIHQKLINNWDYGNLMVRLVQLHQLKESRLATENLKISGVAFVRLCVVYMNTDTLTL